MSASVFDLVVDASILDEIARHAEEKYPSEACGVVLGAAEGPRLIKVVPLGNVQDRLHDRDPEAFPRTGREAFRLDEIEREQVLASARSEGLCERVLFHSHCDAGAYFSPEDRARAVRGNEEVQPGVVHLVVSIRHGRRADMAAFRFDPARRRFDEERVILEGVKTALENALPDLDLRGVESRGSADPIRPVGGRLVPRRLTRTEAATLPALAEGRRLTVRDRTVLDNLERLACGYFSPLSGFLRSAEVRSVESRGRLQTGAPWRSVLTFEVKRAEAPDDIAAGGIVEIVGPGGRGRALLAVAEVTDRKHLCGLGGPVYVYPTDEGMDDALDQRAELLRRGARRVLAIPSAAAAGLGSLDTSGFDVVLQEPGPSSEPPLRLHTHDDPWLTAAMAQNQGATHILVVDPALKARILDTLDIQPWR